MPPVDPCNAPDSLLVELEFTGSGADSIVWNMGDGTIFTNIYSVDYYYTNSIARSSKVMSECKQISKNFLFNGIEKAS